ncbi:hypothetical protein E1295_38745 [Nonomuraea mesophila]|uniref:Uncharacterized protein n=1 Tax=Nonomuraea mesophila TaxID=2530382 RepID=A0A4R5EFK8_9ACTN|nr:hypothetical protein [Nonomuraea mesophila]TDE32977.1 hypothetical protein E1295_38745 [Nonomuraea mesophila]
MAETDSAPGDPERGREPDIAMWGASGSGKTAFLAALSIALNKSRDAGWRLIGENPVSRTELAKLRNTLLQARTFPAPTEALTYYSWMIIGPPETRRRWWWPWTAPPAKAPKIKLDFLDLRGDLYAESESNIDKQALITSLVRSRGLLYMFDPDREARVGDAFKHLDAALHEVAGRMLVGDEYADGKLPHYIAVCITKYDDPRVLRIAMEEGFTERDPGDELRIPHVPADRVRDFFRLLCQESYDHNTETILDLIEAFFHKDRIRYFVTSSVGMFIDEELGRFDPDDFLNVIDNAGGGLTIRGAVRPMNVMEPVIWLGGMLRPGAIGNRRWNG